MNAADSVKRGLLLSGAHSSPAEMATRAQLAEERGFDSIWVNEGAFDAIVPLALIAQSTAHVRLGTACAIVGRHPHLAQLAIAGIESISNGRFSPAFADGPSGPNRSWYGPRPSSPLKRMQEYIEILRLMLSASNGDEVNYEGEYYRVDNYRRLSKPIRDKVPLLVGAAGPRMIEVAGSVADGFVAPALNCRRFFDEVAFPHARTGLNAAGRTEDDFEWNSVRICSVDHDRETARARARRQIAFYVGIAPSLANMLNLLGFSSERSVIEAAVAQGDLDAAAGLVPDALVDELTFAGTPDDCQQQFQDFSTGLDTVILYPPAAGLTRAESLQAHSAVIEAFS
jgi:alkanesulfonate monooxygenase SsuD/methylene tetrahydromethanopterin reductase-like flavin-dependent oxidoreductase (luciferase family)